MSITIVKHHSLHVQIVFFFYFANCGATIQVSCVDDITKHGYAGETCACAAALRRIRPYDAVASHASERFEAAWAPQRSPCCNRWRGSMHGPDPLVQTFFQAPPGTGPYRYRLKACAMQVPCSAKRPCARILEILLWVQLTQRPCQARSAQVLRQCCSREKMVIKTKSMSV